MEGEDQRQNTQKKERTTVFDFCNDTLSTKKSADEVLAERLNKRGYEETIPVKLRDTFHDPELPESELLNVLHYYVAHKFPKLGRAFQESALLTFGLLVDQWTEELLNDKAHLLYSEFANGNYKNSLKEKNRQSREEKRRKKQQARKRRSGEEDAESSGSSSD